ncbi:MAG: DUF882 domain-containing protein [Variibacter sp.]|nr:DUF882 domain-containing protein [Variibacter sp.]
MVLATDGLQTAAANGETRALRIYHTHSRESIDVVFKRNGRYDDAGLAKLNHFLRDWRNQEATKMDPRLFDVVWEVYQEVGGKEPIQIISAYRSPQTNAMLRRRSRGVAKFSQHMLGKAMDFNIPGVSLEQIRHAGLRLQRGGVGFYPTSGSPFVHLDVGSVRHWPRMAPDAYARVMSGRTIRTAGLVTPVTRHDTTPAAATKSQKSWFSRFFTGNDDEDEERDSRATAGRVTPEAAPARTTQVASAVPMPRARPRGEDAPRGPELPASPASVVQARGLWSASEVMAAAEPAPQKKSPNYVQRLVWQVGAQPLVTPARNGTVVSKRMPAPRPRPEVVASAVETTASVPWPMGSREDRIPSDLVMAYAASASGPPAPAVAPAAPMGALKPPARAATRKPAKEKTPPLAAARPMQAPAGRLGDNPWLRGLIISPSVHAAMDVTVLGAPNYRALTALMHKPAAVVPNAFGQDPEFGLTFETFSGSAVSFVPTLPLGTITAARLD